MQGLSTTQEMWVRSLRQEDSLMKEMATQSSILGWKIPQTEGPGGLQSMRSQQSDTTKPPPPPQPTATDRSMESRVSHVHSIPGDHSLLISHHLTACPPPHQASVSGSVLSASYLTYLNSHHILGKQYSIFKMWTTRLMGITSFIQV